MRLSQHMNQLDMALKDATRDIRIAVMYSPTRAVCLVASRLPRQLIFRPLLRRRLYMSQNQSPLFMFRLPQPLSRSPQFIRLRRQPIILRRPSQSPICLRVNK